MKTLGQSISDNPTSLESDEGEKALSEAVSLLPEDQQKVLFLRFNKQMQIKEISLEMRCSITTTYTKLNRALFTLRNKFHPEAYEKMYSILYPETGKPGQHVIAS